MCATINKAGLKPFFKICGTGSFFWGGESMQSHFGASIGKSWSSFKSRCQDKFVITYLMTNTSEMINFVNK